MSELVSFAYMNFEFSFLGAQEGLECMNVTMGALAVDQRALRTASTARYRVCLHYVEFTRGLRQ